MKKLTKATLDKAEKKKLIKQLDILWAKIVKHQWGGKCGWPGCEYPNPRLSAHHWIHRAAGNRARWNTQNSILLCYFHHFHEVHQRGNTEPIRDAIIERIGEDYFEQLKIDVQGVWKPSLDDLRDLKYNLTMLLEGGT
jgi:hypothetical protein